MHNYDVYILCSLCLLGLLLNYKFKDEHERIGINALLISFILGYLIHFFCVIFLN